MPPLRPAEAGAHRLGSQIGEPAFEEPAPQPEPVVDDEWALPPKKKTGKKVESPPPLEEVPSTTSEVVDITEATEQAPAPVEPVLAEPSGEPEPVAEDEWALPSSKKKKKGKKGKAAETDVSEPADVTAVDVATVETPTATTEADVVEPIEPSHDSPAPVEVIPAEASGEPEPMVEDEWAAPSSKKKKKGKKGKTAAFEDPEPTSRALSPVQDIVFPPMLEVEQTESATDAIVDSPALVPEPVVEDEWAPTPKKKKGKKNKGAASFDSPEPTSRAMSPVQDISLPAPFETDIPVDTPVAEHEPIVDTPMADVEPVIEDEWTPPTSKKKKGKKGKAAAVFDVSEPVSRAVSPTHAADPEAFKNAETQDVETSAPFEAPAPIDETPAEAEPVPTEDEWALPATTKKGKNGKKNKAAAILAEAEPQPEPTSAAPADNMQGDDVMAEPTAFESAPDQPEPADDTWGATPSKKSKKDKKRGKGLSASRELSPAREEPVLERTEEPVSSPPATSKAEDTWDAPTSSKKGKKGKKAHRRMPVGFEEPSTSGSQTPTEAPRQSPSSSSYWGELGAAAVAGATATAAVAALTGKEEGESRDTEPVKSSRDVGDSYFEGGLDAGPEPVEAAAADDDDGFGFTSGITGEEQSGYWNNQAAEEMFDVWEEAQPEATPTKSQVASSPDAAKEETLGTTMSEIASPTASKVGTPKSAVGKKKKGKSKKSKYEDKKPGGGDDDPFDDPILWEGADKKHVSEIASFEVEKFWGSGPEASKDVPAAAVDDKTAEDGERSLETDDKPMVQEAVHAAMVEDTMEGVAIAPVQDTKESEPSPVLGRGPSHDEALATTRSVAKDEPPPWASESVRQSIETDIDEAVDRGFEAEQRRDFSEATPTDTYMPAFEPTTDFRRSVSRGLPPVQEETYDEEETGEERGRGRQSFTAATPATPEVNRDSGFMSDSSHRRSARKSKVVVEQDNRDSGVHLREDEDGSRDAARSPELGWSTPKNRSITVPEESSSRRLRRSPLSKGELRERDHPMTKTPVLREPSPRDVTPEPYKTRRHKSPERGIGGDDKRSRYHDLSAGTSDAGASLSRASALTPTGTAVGTAVGRRSVSDHVTRIQSPALGPESSMVSSSVGGGALARRSASNTSLSLSTSRHRMHTPEPLKFRPDSPGSVSASASASASGIFNRRASATPPLRRVDKRVSGDLRSLRQRSELDLAAASPGGSASGSPRSSGTSTSPAAGGAGGAGAAVLAVAGVAAAAAAAGAASSSSSSNNSSTAKPKPDHDKTKSNAPVANEGRVRSKDMPDVYNLN
ncbi:hypothetical protein HYQ44_015850 [Verticillium longisporum]|nr:hypothetical protein HYQ44_015850 [Verticillium longisporum]